VLVTLHMHGQGTQSFLLNTSIRKLFQEPQTYL
jgi:hypothetical protein